MALFLTNYYTSGQRTPALLIMFSALGALVSAALLALIALNTAFGEGWDHPHIIRCSPRIALFMLCKLFNMYGMAEHKPSLSKITYSLAELHNSLHYLTISLNK